MPDDSGFFKGIAVPAEAWERVFGDETRECDGCCGSGECPECGNLLTDDPESCGECSGAGCCPWCGGTGEAC